MNTEYGNAERQELTARLDRAERRARLSAACALAALGAAGLMLKARTRKV